MTVRASSFPSVRLENMKQQRQQRALENQDIIIKTLMQENNERNMRYGERYMKTRNYEQYKKDLDKQQKFMLHRILTAL